MNARLISLSAMLAAGMTLPHTGVALKPQSREMRFSNVAPSFANPGKEYRPAPLWVWNTDVTEADIDRMLADFKQQGFGGAFVHPRPGLMTEYLSDEWFALYRYAVDKGKELGLDIWIYDENSYPSGFAGGHVPAQMPESYNQGQGLAPERCEMLPADVADCYLVLKRDGDSFADITGDCAAHKGVKGDYYVYRKTYYSPSPWNGGYSYVDLLADGVTEKFLDITMKGYEATFGDELGPVIKGLFSDEPCIPGSGGLRWTPDLFKTFEDRWGYSLATSLPLLSERTGDWKRVRHNYMQTLTQMFVDRWAKPMSAYCDSKDMLWTGHYWEHDWPSMHQGGDNMAMYAWHQMPAVDMLFNQYNEESPQAQFGNVRAIKELRSAANQTGCVRTLSETYGGGGWDETFRDFKRLGDWEFALGVNFMNQHLAHMTIVGARKYDYPPVFTRLSPWWSSYGALNDYFGRLSLVLSAGEQLNDILILEPTTTIWQYFSFTTGEPYCMEIGETFQRFVTRLEKAQVEYDLGSENIIKDLGRVNGNRFVVGQRDYGTVVIPPLTENLDSATFSLISEFVNNGGRLLLFSKPTLVDGEYNESLAALVGRDEASVRHYAGLDYEIVRTLADNGRVRFDGVKGGKLYHQRRNFEDGELLFMVNSSLEDSVAGSVSLNGKTLYALDATDGTVHPYAYKPKDGMMAADFEIPAGGSLLLFAAAADGQLPSAPSTSLAVGEELNPTGKMEVHRMKDNVMNLDFCDLITDGETINDLYTFDACNRLFDRYFGTKNPWDSAIQYKQTVLERDTLSRGDVKVRYHFTADASVNAKGMRLIVEQPDVWTVRFNGHELQPVSADTLIDGRMGVYDISRLMVRGGQNTVELALSPMNIRAEIAPVLVCGDFSLIPAERGWTMTKAGALTTGSWKGQGMPFYAWDVAYARQFDIKNPKDGYILGLDGWNGTVAEVYVNGAKAGIIGWNPERLDITPVVKKGRNNVEVRVVGSLKNLFGPHYSHDRGITGPWHWNNVNLQISGDKYDLMDYGMTGDFRLYRRRN